MAFFHAIKEHRTYHSSFSLVDPFVICVLSATSLFRSTLVAIVSTDVLGVELMCLPRLTLPRLI
jgi:hypothetical protein